jgi:hypothetical protein
MVNILKGLTPCQGCMVSDRKNGLSLNVRLKLDQAFFKSQSLAFGWGIVALG